MTGDRTEIAGAEQEGSRDGVRGNVHTASEDDATEESAAEFRERVRNEPGHKRHYGASLGLVVRVVRRWLGSGNEDST